VSEVNGLAAQIESLKPQLEALRQRIPKDAQSKAMLDAIGEAQKKSSETLDGLIGWRVNRNAYSLNFPPVPVDQLAQLAGAIESADAAPNQPAYEVFEELSRRIEPWTTKGRDLLTKDLAAINELARKLNIGVLAPAANSGPTPR